MESSNNCLIIINNVFKNELEDLSFYISRGLSKLHEILIGLPQSLKIISELTDLENDLEYKDKENKINIRLLIQPTYEQIKGVIKHASEVEKSYIVYIGSHCSGYCADWLLKNGVISPNTIFNILSQAESLENVTKDLNCSINIISHGNATYWTNALSKLNDSNKVLIKVLSFSTDPTEGIQSSCPEIDTFAEVICKHFRSLIKVDDCLSYLQSAGTLQLSNTNGSLYIFDEGCGQSSLLSLDGFNLLIDAGYSHAPQFWKLLQRLDRIDACLMTSWNETNIFGIQSLLDLKLKLDKRGPCLNYCILPTGPSISESCPTFELKSSLEINLQIEAIQICKKLQDLEIPLLQLFREEKTMKSSHQLYFKLGHGFLETYTFWPCSPDNSEDSRKYASEWPKMGKGQSIHFDDMIKDNSSACLLVWNGSKINENNLNSCNIMRILVSSSCSEMHLIKAFEDLSRSNECCCTQNGKPVTKNNEEKKLKSVSATKKVLGGIKDNQAITKPIKNDKKNPSVSENIKNKEVSKPNSATKSKENKPQSSAKGVPSKDITNIEKKKTVPEKSKMKNESESKPLARNKSPPAQQSLKGDKRLTVSENLGKVIDKNTNRAEKATKPKDASIIEKNQQKSEKQKPTKKVDKGDSKFTGTQANETKQAKSEIISKKVQKLDSLESTNSSKQPSTKSTDIHDSKTNLKKPFSDNVSKKPIVDSQVKDNKSHKKVIETKSEGEKVPLKSTKKPFDGGSRDKTSKPLKIESAEVTINKNDVESDPEKVDAACHQPSISLHTDDTLNNIDTSELLGKMEEIRPYTDQADDDQLIVMSDLRDLHSTPLSDMITESPGHPKTEEDVEPLKTDCFSIDQDLLNVNDDLPEDDRIVFNDNKGDVGEDSKVSVALDVGNVDDLRQYGIYEGENLEELRHLDNRKNMGDLDLMFEEKCSDDSLEKYEKDGTFDEQCPEDERKYDESNQFEYFKDNVRESDRVEDDLFHKDSTEIEDEGFHQHDEDFIENINNYDNKYNENVTEHPHENHQNAEDLQSFENVFKNRSEEPHSCSDNSKESDEDSLHSQEQVIGKENELKNICGTSDSIQNFEGTLNEGNEYEGKTYNDLEVNEDNWADNLHGIRNLEDDVGKCVAPGDVGESSMFLMGDDKEGLNSFLKDKDEEKNGEDKDDIDIRDESGILNDRNDREKDPFENEDVLSLEDIRNMELTNIDDVVHTRSIDSEGYGQVDNDVDTLDIQNEASFLREIKYDEEFIGHDSQQHELNNYENEVKLDKVRDDCEDFEVSSQLQFNPTNESIEERDKKGISDTMEHEDEMSFLSESKGGNDYDHEICDTGSDAEHNLPFEENNSGTWEDPTQGAHTDEHEANFDPPSYSPDLNSTSPADSDLSADIVKDHSITDDTFENTEQTNVKLMTPLDELSEEGSPFGACQNIRLESDAVIGDGAVYQSDEDINNITDLEIDPNLSNTTPDIIKGLKSFHPFGKRDHPSEQFIIDEDLFQYQTTRGSYIDHHEAFTRDVNKGSEERDLLDINPETTPFDDDVNMDSQSNVSERWNSDESASSVIAQKASNNEFDLRNIQTSTSIQENEDDQESSSIVDINPLTQWNHPLNLPLPTISADNKPPSKSLNQKVLDRKKPSSSSSEKLKISKMGGSLSNTVAKTAQKTSDSAHSSSSPRPGSTPKSIAKSTVPKETKKLDTVDHSKLPAFYVDVAFVPVDRDGNVTHTRVSDVFFTRIRAQKYILPGMEHDYVVLENILAARKKWSEPDMEVTLIPVKMTETLMKWKSEHEQELSELNMKIGATVENSSFSLEGVTSTTHAAHHIDF